MVLKIGKKYQFFVVFRGFLDSELEKLFTIHPCTQHSQAQMFDVMLPGWYEAACRAVSRAARWRLKYIRRLVHLTMAM